MTFNEYQAAALRTAKPRQDYRERMMEGVLGLCGEAGEVADMVKKSAYQGHLMTTAGVAEELGDVLWYAALVAKAAGLTLDEVARGNIEKLWKRYPEGFDSNRSIHREENGGTEG